MRLATVDLGDAQAVTVSPAGTGTATWSSSRANETVTDVLTATSR